jgi:AcrR family transcriptional regulator
MYNKTMKRAAEEALQTRESLLDSAMKVFLEKGYSDARIEDISEAAGVTRGAFYHHFDGKKEIYFALVEERCRPAMMLAVGLESDSALDPRGKLREFIAGYIRLLSEDKGFREATELTILKTAAVPELQEGMETKRASMHATQQWMKDIIEGLGVPEAAAAAFVLHSALSGVTTLWLIDPTLYPIEGNADRIADLILKLIGK